MWYSSISIDIPKKPHEQKQTYTISSFTCIDKRIQHQLYSSSLSSSCESSISSKSTQTNISIPPQYINNDHEIIEQKKDTDCKKEDIFNIDEFDGRIESLPHVVFENIALDLFNKSNK